MKKTHREKYLMTLNSAPNKVVQPKAKQAAKPKPATSTPKSATNSARGRQSKRGGRGGRSGGRPKPKTAEELDAEMADYWDGGSAPSAGAVAAAAAPAAATGGEAMDDILVGTLTLFIPRGS